MSERTAETDEVDEVDDRTLVHDERAPQAVEETAVGAEPIAAGREQQPGPVPEPASPRDRTSDVAPLVTARKRRGRGRRALLAAVIVLLIVGPAAVAGWISARSEPTYAARAEVLFEDPAITDAQTMERAMTTQQLLLQSRQLVDAAATAVRRDRQELSEDLTVEVVEQSDLLRVTVEDTDDERALAATTALVQAYVDAAAALATANSTAAQERGILQPQVDGLATRLNEIQARLAQLVRIAIPSAAQAQEARTLEGEAQIIRQRLVDLQAQLLDVDLRAVQEATPPARVATPPYVLDDPVGPQPLRAAAAGLLLGVLLATGLVLLVRWRRRLGAASDL